MKKSKRDSTNGIKDNIYIFVIMRTGDKVLISPDLVFTKLFEEAEIAKFTPTELKEYEDSLKAYRDVKNSIDTALEKGREEGMAKGMEIGMEKGIAKGMEKEKLATAHRLLSMGLSDEQVSTVTELPLEEIQKLKEQA